VGWGGGGGKGGGRGVGGGGCEVRGEWGREGDAEEMG